MAVGMTEVVAMMEVSKKIKNNDDADDRRERTNGRQKSTKASARGVDGDKNRSCNQCNFTLEPSVEHIRQLPRLDMSFVLTPTCLSSCTCSRAYHLPPIVTEWDVSHSCTNTLILHVHSTDLTLLYSRRLAAAVVFEQRSRSSKIYGTRTTECVIQDMMRSISCTPRHSLRPWTSPASA